MWTTGLTAPFRGLGDGLWRQPSICHDAKYPLSGGLAGEKDEAHGRRQIQ
jgi:hypothetical protein